MVGQLAGQLPGQKPPQRPLFRTPLGAFFGEKNALFGRFDTPYFTVFRRGSICKVLEIIWIWGYFVFGLKDGY